MEIQDNANFSLANGKWSLPYGKIHRKAVAIHDFFYDIKNDETGGKDAETS